MPEKRGPFRGEGLGTSLGLSSFSLAAEQVRQARCHRKEVIVLTESKKAVFSAAFELLGIFHEDCLRLTLCEKRKKINKENNE